jgi:hypothetical protein
MLIEIRSVIEPKKVPGDGEGRVRIGTYGMPRRRKEFHFDLPPTWLVFEGWEVPFKADTDGGGIMAGNACYNLVGEAAVIRDWVESKNLNLPFSDADKAKVLAWDETRENVASAGTLVFPEIPTGHAVVNKIKHKAGQQQQVEQGEQP